MHRTTKRLASALLAAVLCAAAALPAGADYEPWTYEVDSVMGGYGVEYYSDVGFENPTSKPSTTTAQQSSGGVSTYSSAQTGRAVALAGAESGTAVDTGLGYTVTQLPGGITLYSPTDSGVSTYAMDSDLAVSNDVATYAASGSQQVSGSDSGAQTFSVTIPATLELDKEKAQTMTLTGQVYSYSTLNISVDKENGTHELKCSDDGQALEYKLTCSDLLTSKYNNMDYQPIKGDGTHTDGSWDNAVTADAGSIYLKATLTAELADTNSYDIAGDYTDTITFKMASSRKKFDVTYNSNNDSAAATTNKIYVCGGSGSLPTAESLGFTAPEGKRFIGWATWQDASENGADKKVYAPGMMFAMIANKSENAIANAYTAKEPSSVTLYAYWRETGKGADYEATVYVEKASVNFSAKNGVLGSGVYIHEDDPDNYEAGGTDKLLPAKVQLQNVDIAPGETCFWSLTELENHLPDGTIPEGNKIYLDDGNNAAKVVASEDGDDKGHPTSVTLYVNRNLVCFDLNARVKVLGADSYTNGGALVFALSSGREVDLGTADVTVYGKNITNTAHTDCWQIVTYGTEVTIKVTGKSPFQLVGHQCKAGGEKVFDKDIVGNEHTFTVLVEPGAGVKSFSFYPLYDEVTTTEDVADDDTVTLLPEMDKTKPVVIDMPTIDLDDAADAKADTKKDTAADTTESTAKADTKADDTTTTGSGTKADTKASDTTADAADEKTTTDTTTKADADTTPDDLMIWDADTMPALVVDDYDANELAVVW